jgi:hypothetical protein
MRSRLVRGLAVALALAWLAAAIPVRATSVRVVNLRDLVERSDRIFVGKCLSETSEIENGIPTTAYTFEVRDGVKGVAPGATVTVRQLGLAEPVRVNDEIKRVLRIDGMPRYTKGREVLLFLTPESKLGLSAPVGLAQGAFHVLTKGDRQVLVNGAGNANLYHELSPGWAASKGVAPEKLRELRARDDGAVEYNKFLSMVRALVQGGR